MKLKVTDEELIKIYNIRNIESIKFTDLMGHNDDKLIIVPSLMVVYDNGKFINLCSKDKHFDIFVKKVLEVYNDEKNNSLEDSLTDPFKLHKFIQIDEKTKRILENGSLNIKNDLYTFYENKEFFESSLIFEIDEVKSILDIVKYHLKDVLSRININIYFNDLITGYKNNYAIYSNINGKEDFILLKYTKDDKYNFEISNILKEKIFLKINFKNDRIYISCDIPKLDLYSNDTYLISTNVIKHIKEIKRNKKNICYENYDLEETENPNKNLLYGIKEVKWFKLPWNAYYGINNHIYDISETEKISEIYNVYLATNNYLFYRREHFFKSYKRKNTVSVTGKSVVLDEVESVTTGVNIDKRLFLIETKFNKVNNPNGYYKLGLENKYFYHLVKSKLPSILEIDKDNFVSISKDDVFEKGDLLENDKILKLVGGK